MSTRADGDRTLRAGRMAVLHAGLALALACLSAPPAVAEDPPGAAGVERAASEPGRTSPDAGSTRARLGPPDVAPARADAETLLPTRPAAGEFCRLCGRALGAGDVAYRIRGRWVPVHTGPCAAAFRDDPGVVFAALQPRAALFTEDLAVPPALRWGWFAFGAYVLAGLACGAACSHLAYPRRRAPARWFALGFLFNLAAVAALLAAARPVEAVPGRLARIPGTADPLPCPACASGNHPAARRCASCGAALSPGSEAEVARVMGARS